MYLLCLRYVPGYIKELEEEEYGFLLRSSEYGLASFFALHLCDLCYEGAVLL